jgi:hypothetical protein
MPITERDLLLNYWCVEIAGSHMDDAARVRERAVRLYALALQARERGYTSASELERLANETIAHAEELDRRTRIVTPPAEMPQQIAQQTAA